MHNLTRWLDTVVQTQGGYLSLATDGWSRSHCENGTPLMNACPLHPNEGGSTFLKVRAMLSHTVDVALIA